MVWLYVVGCWMFGFAWLAILSALGWSDRRLAAVVRRVVYVLGVVVVLGATTVIVAASTGPHAVDPSSAGIWAYCLGAALPVTVSAFLVARRTFPRPGLAGLGTLGVLAYVAAAGASFREYRRPLDGLALTVHDHHVLAVAAMVALLVVLVLACVPRKPRWDAGRAGSPSAQPQTEVRDG